LYGPLVDQVLADEQLAPPPGTGRQAEDWAGPVLWPLADHLGTLRDLAAYDPQGTPGQETSLASHRTFDAFGNLVDETNPAVDILFAFTGRERDDETGLQYNRARYYDSATGNWINPDPIGFAGGDPNVQRYARNNPTGVTDPSGQSWLEVAGDFGTGILQGGADILNGLQDIGIGILNLPAAGTNGIAWVEEQIGILNPDDPIRIPYIPSPDWSEGIFVSPDLYPHDVNKAIGGTSAAILIAAPARPEITIYGSGNVFKIISRPLRCGFRIDPAHHGQPWGHMHIWWW